MRLVVASVVLGFSAFVFAQLSPQEAQQRLEEAEARGQVEDVQKLRAERAALRKECDQLINERGRLATEVQSLKSTHGQMSQTRPATEAALRAFGPGRLAKTVDFRSSEEIKLNTPLVDRIEFTSKRFNMTLRNMTGNSAPVDVQVLVLNADGVIVWGHQESWAIQHLEEEERYEVSKAFQAEMPSSLLLSRYAADFDVAPKQIVIIETRVERRRR